MAMDTGFHSTRGSSVICFLFFLQAFLAFWLASAWQTSRCRRYSASCPGHHRTISSGHALDVIAGGGAELGGRFFDVAFLVLAGERRAATFTPVRCARGAPR